jgi:CubicO group peptidase (beta-lactamase class C family)
MDTVIHGHCDQRFSAVREAFAEGFRSRNEIGAAVAVMLDGRPVVDLWAGSADLARSKPWQRDTIVNVYSCTKGMTALCAHQLVERGQLDLDAPVAKYWPEFARGGKERLPVRWLLSHRAGLAAVRQVLPPEALYDWDAMCAALAAQEPWWEPGTAHGYHAVSFGWLVGEVVRRISGRGLGTYFCDEIAAPLGLDLHIGLAEAEHSRVAEMSEIPTDGIDADALGLAQVIFADPQSMAALAFVNPPSMALGPNNAAWRSAEIPGANGHGTARDLACVYGALARGGRLGGVRVLAPESIARCAAEQSRGRDLVLQIDTRFGLGFMLPQDRRDARFGPSPRAFGHPGAGGSLGFADPDNKVGFGYVMNRMGPHILLDPRAGRADRRRLPGSRPITALRGRFPDTCSETPDRPIRATWRR